MPEVRFYHLTRGTLENTLAVMLPRVLARSQRAVIQLSSEERVESVANLLWSYDDTSFLPHGTQKDGAPQRQPLWLTSKDAPAPNGAEVLFLGDGAESGHLESYALVVFVFDGGNPDAVASAREQWRAFKSLGYELTYWQQDDAGRWSKKAG